MLGNPTDITVNGNPVTGRDKVINYIRGADVLDEDADGDTYENRSIITGDVLHSEPMVFTYQYADDTSKTLVFFGANDGMLHAVLDVTDPDVIVGLGCGQRRDAVVNGDVTTYAELMPLFEADEQTQGIVIYTEPGGRMEAELARWVTENDSRLPIVAFMAGRFMDEMPGMSFGHAGTIVEGKEDTATEKIARLAEAGITVAEEISQIPEIIKTRIAERQGAAA